VLDSNCRSAALSFAYAAVAEISVSSALAMFLCCCSTSADVYAPNFSFFCSASNDCAA
jgi:hypothetical protein